MPVSTLPLIDLLASDPATSDTSVVVAKRPFTWGCEAAVVKLTPENALPMEVKAQGLEYFLGFDDIGYLITQTQRKRCTEETRVEFLLPLRNLRCLPCVV